MMEFVVLIFVKSSIEISRAVPSSDGHLMNTAL